VAATIDAREILLKALTKLTDETRAALKEDNRRFDQLNGKKERLDNEHKRLEERIERGDGENGTLVHAVLEPERPDMEPLTPPPVETLTPPPNPSEDDDDENLYSPPRPASGKSGNNIRVASDASLQGQSPIKKRRLENHDEFAAFADGGALGGLDPDVEAMLNG
jgi:hypothetical protein